MRDLTLSVVIAIIVILFLYQPVKVEGTSMMPALTDQERIFINKFVYRFHVGDIQRGDMIVFWYPNDPTKSYIKRVIGTPGDRIEVDLGTVIVNGKALKESYVPPEYRDQTSMPLTLVPEIPTLCWAIIAAPPTTAARGAWCRAGSFTARPYLCIGRSIKSAC